MKKILVCTDGSPYAEASCEYAAWLAKKTGAFIKCLYVSNVLQFEMSAMADFGGNFGVQPYHTMIEQVREMEERKGKLIRGAVKALFEKEGLGGRYRFHQHMGHLVDCIGEFEEEVDLILLGKRGESANLAKEHLGSSMERVVRACEKPCMVTSRKFRPVQKVLVAYDKSPSCVNALDFMVHSKVFEGLEVHLVVVAKDKEEEEITEKYWKQGNAVLCEGGYKPKGQMLTGVVEDEIVKYIESKKIDLLVMGAYGHGQIRSLIIGSTTTDLVRRSRVPVMLFR